jgi:hypothetical protein
MILTILSIVLVAVCSYVFKKAKYTEEIKLNISVTGLVLGTILLICCVLIIIGCRIGTGTQIYEYKMQYDGLCKRIEAVQSEYEDVSKSDLIADITEWNKEVYHKKYWSSNPWTSWLNNKQVADSLEYIEY